MEVKAFYKDLQRFQSKRLEIRPFSLGPTHLCFDDRLRTWAQRNRTKVVRSSRRGKREDGKQ